MVHVTGTDKLLVRRIIIDKKKSIANLIVMSYLSIIISKNNTLMLHFISLFCFALKLHIADLLSFIHWSFSADSADESYDSQLFCHFAMYQIFARNEHCFLRKTIIYFNSSIYIQKRNMNWGRHIDHTIAILLLLLYY